VKGCGEAVIGIKRGGKTANCGNRRVHNNCELREPQIAQIIQIKIGIGSAGNPRCLCS
jgi:hypothetical protein